jgi:hypothetical protein
MALSDRAFDSLFEILAEVAAEDMPVAEILRVGEELHRAGVRAVHVRRLLQAGLTVKLGEGGPRLPQPPPVRAAGSAAGVDRGS